MYLVGAEERPDLAENWVGLLATERWNDFQPSSLSHHGRPCCELAIEWLRSMDFAQLNGADRNSGPRWLREKYKWGPSAWPIHWCEAIESEILDCGVHSAFAQHVFDAREIANFRAQLVQRYNQEAIDQWQTIWTEDGASNHWLGEGFIYHEVNAILVGGSLKLWDGSASCWINPVQRRGYGSILSVRIFRSEKWPAPDLLSWGRHRIVLNEWIEIVPQ